VLFASIFIAASCCSFKAPQSAPMQAAGRSCELDKARGFAAPAGIQAPNATTLAHARLTQSVPADGAHGT